MTPEQQRDALRAALVQPKRERRPPQPKRTQPRTKAKKGTPRWWIDVGEHDLAHWRALTEWWRTHGTVSKPPSGSLLEGHMRAAEVSAMLRALQELALHCLRHGLDAAGLVALKTRRAAMQDDEAALPALLAETDAAADLLELRLLAAAAKKGEQVRPLQGSSISVPSVLMQHPEVTAKAIAELAGVSRAALYKMSFPSCDGSGEVDYRTLRNQVLRIHRAQREKDSEGRDGQAPVELRKPDGDLTRLPARGRYSPKKHRR